MKGRVICDLKKVVKVMKLYGCSYEMVHVKGI